MMQALKNIGGRFKAGSLSREQLRLGLLAVICLLMVVYGYRSILVEPLQARLAVMAQQATELEEQLQKLPPPDGDLDQQARRVASLKEKMAAEQESLARLQERMATEKDVARVVKTLALTADPKDFTLLALRKKTPVVRENYVIQPFEVDFQADYRKMASYLRAFSRGEKLYTVDELQIVTSEKVLPQVEVRLVINNYRFRQDGPAAGQDPEAAGSAAGAPRSGEG
ncbi:MAG: type 4a pilus biogenesis protein PilO [Deltaproteobacteria bacterium]|nr:type 4a pilus biogenesis protein PilO [Deltaproteobacteria bacterium]